MDWKKNDVFQVKIEDLSDAGEGIGKTEGYTWFIKDAVIGDTVEAKVMKTKKTYGFARMMNVVVPSPWRVEPVCPVARQCGGCQLQSMSYEAQLRFKENKVRNNLMRIGGLAGLTLVDESGAPRRTDGLAAPWGADEMAAPRRVDGMAAPQAIGGERMPCGIEMCGEIGTDDICGGKAKDKDGGLADDTPVPMYPIIGMDNPWRYRNKAQFPFARNREGKIITGFYAGRTHTIIENEDCLLGAEENKVILKCIRTYMEEFGITPYNEESHTGLVRHVLIRKSFKTGELMVCLVINGDVKALKKADVLVTRLTGLFMGEGQSGVKSISCNINREKTNVIMGTELVNLYGPGYITDFIGNVEYRISPLSFYQVNPVQTEKLYRTALEFAGLTGGEVVWDLYCGIGTISLFLAQKAKKVYGVEVVPQAIDDARANAALNGIGNVEFFVGKAEEVLPEQYEKHHIYADVIVVDPPRKGCDVACLDTIARMKPRRVVYVSCDSATLARDVRYLGERGFEVRGVRGVDMFGMSGHCEVCVEICRINKSL